MSVGTFERVEQAFIAAMAARDAGEEPSFTQICNGDPALIAEVQALLGYAKPEVVASSKITQSLFLDPAELHGDRADNNELRKTLMLEWDASAVGQRIGEFTLIAPLGMGGMGVVFLAEQERPRRMVALKLIRRNAATPRVVRRFEREAQLLGRLNHPGIAQIYAAGVAEITSRRGDIPLPVPYLAMERIEGPTILEYIRANALDDGEARRLALHLIVQTCDAVAHAHQRGVIHRDLKPANILVCLDADNRPQVKVLDFGVARPASGAADDSGAMEATLTGEGFLIGTLAYMSPEQARGNETTDVRSDVYAIGVMLYQMLCGKLPLCIDGCSLPEAARRIAEDEPIKPSTHCRALRGDLETIVAKALEKEPARRYQSCTELARDIRHYLSGEPIEARRDSIAYVLGKRVVAYRRLAWTAVLLLALLAAFAVYAVQQQQVQRQAAAAATAARVEADTAAGRLASELSASHVEQGHLLGESGNLTSAERLLWGEYFGGPRREQAEWGLRELYARNGCLRTLRTQAGECRAVSVSADGRQFVTGGTGPDVNVWSVDTGKRIASFDSTFGNVWATAMSHNGRYVIAGGDRGACIFDTKTNERRPIVTGGGDVWGVAASPDDPVVALGTRAGFVRLFDAATGKLLLELNRRRPYDDEQLPDAPVHNVTFDSSGQQVAAVYDDGEIRVWQVWKDNDGWTGKSVAELAGHARGTTVCAVAFNPYDNLLVTGGNDRLVKVWRIADGSEIATCPTNNGTARTISFTPDGAQIAVSGLWRTQVMNVADALREGTAVMTPLGDDDSSYAATFTPDGRRLITGYTSGNCRIWDRTTDKLMTLANRNSRVCGLETRVVGDECVMASSQENGDVIVRRCPLSQTRQADAWHVSMHTNVADAALSMTMSPDAGTIVVGYTDGSVVSLNAASGAVEQTLHAHGNQINSLAISQSGRLLVTGGADGRTCVWERAATIGPWSIKYDLACGGGVLGVAIDPQEQVLATTAMDRSVRLWSLRSGLMLTQNVEYRTPWRLSFSKDGKRLASGLWDRSVRVWSIDANAPKISPQLQLTGHDQLVSGQMFDPTGRYLASTSNDGTLRLWDVSTGSTVTGVQADDRRRCLATFDAHAGDALAVAFMPAVQLSGQPVIAAGYADGGIRIWSTNAYDENLAGQADYQRNLH